MKKRYGLVFILILILSISNSFNVLALVENTSTEEIEQALTQTQPDLSSIDYNALLANERFYHPTTAQMIEIDSMEELTVTPLISLLPKTSDIAYNAYEQFLLNFSYIKSMEIPVHQEDNEGIIIYNFNETITITFYAFFPVILDVYRNTSLKTDQTAHIITHARVDPSFKAKIGIRVDFYIEYFIEARLPLFNLPVGPGNHTFPFDKHWEFDTPLDGQLIGEKQSLPSIPILPPPEPTVITLGLGVQPKIDADFSAKLKTDDSNISLSTDNLKWERNNSIQSFAVSIPEFYNKDTMIVDLFDFDMEFILSLQFFLEIGVPIIPIINKKFSLPIFAIPIAKEHLQLTDNPNLSLKASVTPSDDLPYVYGVDYEYSDEQGDNDDIIEPGEQINFDFIVTNLGNGSALDVKTSVSSDNVTVTGTDSVPILYKNTGNYELQKGFSFTVPSDYSGYFILVTATFEYLSVNGSLFSNDYEMIFIVVHFTDMYLEVSEIIFEHLGDYWQSGDNLRLYFNVTNRGSCDITYADLYLYDAFDTDVVHPVTIISDITNSTSLAVGESAILGPIEFSSPPEHDDGLIYVYIYSYYENGTHIFEDPYYGGIPIFLPKPYLSLQSAIGYETDGDGLFEAGETVEIEFTLENLGEGTGFDIQGEITTDNPDLNFTNSHVYFGDIAPYSSITSTKAILEIPQSARNQTANFTLHLSFEDSTGNVYSGSINISIDIIEAPLPKIDLLSYTLDDFSYGDGDGIPEPGEFIFLYINIQVEYAGFNIIGSANSTAPLEFYNYSSFYGDLMNEHASGDGFIIYIPLDYPGDDAIIDVTIYAESYSGRKVNATGYLILDDIPKGDLTAPEISLLDSIPNQLNVSDQNYSFSFTVEDKDVTGEITTGIDFVAVIWIFNDSEVYITELTEINGNYIMTLNTSNPGIYYFLLVAVDIAGNIQFLMNNDDIFTVSIASSSSDDNNDNDNNNGDGNDTGDQDNTTPTAPTTSTKTSYLPVIWIFTILTTTTIILRKRIKR